MCGTSVWALSSRVTSDRARHVLLVSKDEDSAVAHERVVHNCLRAVIICIGEQTEFYPIHPLTHFSGGFHAHLKLAGGFCDALAVLAVNDIDEAVGVVEVVAPQRPQLLLAAHIPDSEQHVFVLHLLHVETCRQQQALLGAWAFAASSKALPGVRSLSIVLYSPSYLLEPAHRAGALLVIATGDSK